MPFNPLYTFAQARTELQLRIGGRTDLGSGTQDRLAQWLNNAQYRIASAPLAMEDLDIISFPLITVAGQSQYGLLQILPPATDLLAIRAVRNDTTMVRMVRFPWTDFRAISQQAQSAPLRWTRWGYTLAFDPQPDNNGPYTILIDYRRQPQQGVTEIPNTFQEDWITVAEWIAWKALRKPDEAAKALGMLPQAMQAVVQQTMDMDQWEAKWDPDLAIRPVGFDSPYSPPYA